MTTPKKRLSKAAKAAQKILEDSKLFAANKTIGDAKADQTFRPNESPLKPTTTANKMRPNKKRG